VIHTCSRLKYDPMNRLFAPGKLLLFLLPFLLLAGCGEYQEVQVTQIGGLKIVKLTDKGVELEIGMKIKNPNTYGFTLFPSEFEIYLSGTDLGKARLTKKENIAPNSEEMHYFHVASTFDKLAGTGVPGLLMLFGSKQAEIEIKGNLKAGRFLFRRKIPVDRKQKVNMDKSSGGSLLDLFKN
jgi:LEA14-like dessication related protein